MRYSVAHDRETVTGPIYKRYRTQPSPIDGSLQNEHRHSFHRTVTYPQMVCIRVCIRFGPVTNRARKNSRSKNLGFIYLSPYFPSGRLSRPLSANTAATSSTWRQSTMQA